MPRDTVRHLDASAPIHGDCQDTDALDSRTSFLSANTHQVFIPRPQKCILLPMASKSTSTITTTATDATYAAVATPRSSTPVPQLGQTHAHRRPDLCPVAVPSAKQLTPTLWARLPLATPLPPFFSPEPSSRHADRAPESPPRRRADPAPESPPKRQRADSTGRAHPITRYETRFLQPVPDPVRIRAARDERDARHAARERDARPAHHTLDGNPPRGAYATSRGWLPSSVRAPGSRQRSEWSADEAFVRFCEPITVASIDLLAPNGGGSYTAWNVYAEPFTLVGARQF
ncbi:hypothetical protein C8F04DRAFT_1295747 [Mycena alexandri]|uniref:Uncharacterized protein n=1 Tax=Mycena alexandri TaxID=1745969 RepID=A0AAD6SGW1_9AGAR|nr:hypothetical protein C8F04DRAFT_1295747 [Mycena alexandri]